MIFDKYDNKEIGKALFEIDGLLKKGYDQHFIIKELKGLNIDSESFIELFSIAKARIKGKEKFKDSSQMFINLEDLRFSTPDFIASYRAKRLKCSVIVDLCSGIGSQSIAFARECKKVYSIEVDPRKVEYAKRNAALFGIENIEFICGDVLDTKVISQLAKAKVDVIFCDPERLPSEAERKIENITIVSSILEKYTKICSNMGIEVPPQISPDKIDYECEKEYLSVDGDLNRLNLYFGKLKKEEIIVVSLSSEEKLVSGGKKLKLSEKAKNLRYIYDVDKAVLKAGLLEELNFILGKGFYVFKRLKKNLFLTSDSRVNNAFLQGFEVVQSTENFGDKVLNSLRDLNAKDVILRGEIPESSYWGLRKSFESKLNGTEKFYLFIFDIDALICRKIGD